MESRIDSHSDRPTPTSGGVSYEARGVRNTPPSPPFAGGERLGLARREFRRILLIKPSSPGDILHALPVLHGLRRRYPSAHLAWLVATPFANLIEADPALNEVIPFDRGRYARVGRSWVATGEFVAFLRDLRRRRFDLVIDLQGLFRSGFLAWATGAGVRLGFRQARELSWIFYSHQLRPAVALTHAADRNYEAARMLGFGDAAMDFSVGMTEADRQRARELIRESWGETHEEPRAGEGGSVHWTPRPYVVLAPATRWETKTWPAVHYGELAAAVSERSGFCCVLAGGAGDAALGAEAAAASAGAGVNLCGRTTLRELAALIAGARMVVTADSTPMHLAAALGRPMVALFGPTNPARTGPYGRSRDVLRLDLPCSPCYLRRLRECRYEHACMRDLTVERVAAAVMERMDEADGRGGLLGD